MQSIIDLCPPGKRLDLIIDTDAYNEIDDQFAIILALLSPERFRVRALHAAPFENHRVASYGEGMERSFEEILRLLDFLDLAPGDHVKRGALSRFGETPDEFNPAVDNLIAMAADYTPDNPLFVVAVGAITNVAEALRREPSLADRIVLFWLGGHPSHWPHNREFNLRGDPAAVRFIMESPVRFGWFPCAVVAEALKTTLSEMELNVSGRGPLGNYLFRIFKQYEYQDLTAMAASKTIWDLAPFAWLIDADTCNVRTLPRPSLDAESNWQSRPDGAEVMEAIRVRRDPVFRDLFEKLAAFSEGRIKPVLD